MQRNKTKKNYGTELELAFNSLNPDYIQELAVLLFRDYKRDKYKNIADFRSTLAENRKVYSHTIEISTLGFISDINE